MYIEIPDEDSINTIYDLFATDTPVHYFNDIITLYLGVYFDVKKNMKEALFWYCLSGAILGNSYGMANLGLCYYEGKGVKQNFEMAVHWYRKSIKFGNSYAMNYLGGLLLLWSRS